MTAAEKLLALARELAGRDEAEQLYALRRMTTPQLRRVLEAWLVWAHDGQLPPDGDWRIWLMMAGRGFGKTRAGRGMGERAGAARGAGLRIALVGATPAEVERVMVEGRERAARGRPGRTRTCSGIRAAG